MNDLHQFLFGTYPYVALAIFLAGSLMRFDREQYSWKSESSQMLRNGQLRLGSNLFHVGVLMLFGGHFVGLLTPKALYHAAGLSTGAKQLIAMTAGGIAGTLCLVGLLLLIHRRLADPRIRASSRPLDFIVLFWLLATLGIGLASIFASTAHLDGSVMVALSHWAQHIVTFRGDAAAFIVDVPTIYKVHLFFGLTLFVLFPLTRLVHVWSGFGAALYLTRPYQLVRRRGPAR